MMDLFHDVTKNYVAKSPTSRMASCLWLAKRLMQKVGVRKQVNNKTKFYPDNAVKIETSSSRISGLSKRLLPVLVENLDNAANRRMVNAEKWIDTISWSSAGRLSSVVSFENPPYLAKFSGSSFECVTEMYDSLTSGRVGLPLSSWPDLPPKVVNKNHKRANDLRKTQMFLPVHQSLSTEKIGEFGVKIIKKLTEKWTTKKLSSSQWDAYWRDCASTNLLQSWYYGEAKAVSEGWKPDRLLVLDHHENPVAIVQVLVKKISFIGGIARINRGPLLLKKHSAEKELGLFFGSLNTLIREARLNRYWFISVTPEMHQSDIANNALRALGFYKAKTYPWSSGLISLSLDEEAVLMSFNA
jgi:hypothetical protein